MSFETRFSDIWSEPELRHYLGEIKRRHGVVETLALPSMRDLPPVQIETLFVPPLLAQSTVSADSDPKTWPPGRSLMAELDEFRQLVVLGDPGGGKTTLSNWLAWRLAAGLNAPLPDALLHRVPIPCVLRDMPAELFTSDVDLIDLAYSVAENLMGRRATTALKAVLRDRVLSGGYVLILDGVDEIPILHRQAVSKWIRQAFMQGACTLATSRVVGYEDYPVDCRVNPISNAAGKLPSDKSLTGERIYSLESIQPVVSNLKVEFSATSKLDLGDIGRWASVRYLMPFDQGRVAAFAKNWYRQRCGSEQEATQKTTDLLAALSLSEVTQKLARTPNLLSLMAIVHRERAHLPDGKALLYEEIANAYINTIDKQRKIAPGDILAQYGWSDRKAWLSYVGFKMQETRSLQIDGEAGILVDESDVVQWLSDAMASSGVPETEEAAKTFLYWVARRSGLLLPRGEARYAFVHLSFQEYFCACYLDSCIVRPAFIRDKLEAEADVTKLKLVGWSQETRWLETLVFLFELLSAERDSEWVDDLAQIIFEDSIKTGAYFRAFELAARIVKNKHIKISGKLRDALAGSLSGYAIREYENNRYAKEDGVLSSLLHSGYAALVKGKGAAAVEYKAGIASKVIGRLKEVASPEMVRVLIVDSIHASDIKFLSLFVNVISVYISDSNILSSSFLGEFKYLENLHLASVPITDISSLNSVPNIRSLKLVDTPVSNISPLGSMKGLDALELSGTKVSDLTILSRLKVLTKLDISGGKVKSLAPVGAIKSLSTLFLDEILVNDFSPLESLKKLSVLRIDNSEIKDFGFCSGLKKLNTMQLMNVKVKDFSAVKDAKLLESLYIFSSKIPSMRCLSELPNLKSFGVLHMPIVDVEFVVGMKKLDSLYLSGTKIKDLTPLVSLKSLYSISLYQDSIKDISPLGACERLMYVTISTKSRIDGALFLGLKHLRIINIKTPLLKNVSLLQSVEGLRVNVES